MNSINLLTILLPSVITFAIGIFISFPIHRWLIKNEIWKKKNVTKSIDGKDAPITAMIHNDEKVKVRVFVCCK